MSAHFALNISQKARNARLATRNAGKSSPKLAIRGWAVGLMRSLKPMSSITTMVAMLAPAIILNVNSFIVLEGRVHYLRLLSKSHCFSSLLRLS